MASHACVRYVLIASAPQNSCRSAGWLLLFTDPWSILLIYWLSLPTHRFDETKVKCRGGAALTTVNLVCRLRIQFFSIPAIWFMHAYCAHAYLGDYLVPRHIYGCIVAAVLRHERPRHTWLFTIAYLSYQWLELESCHVYGWVQHIMRMWYPY